MKMFDLVRRSCERKIRDVLSAFATCIALFAFIGAANVAEIFTADPSSVEVALKDADGGDPF